MNEGRTEQALAVFRRAVDKAPGNARAALGLGMALLAGNDVQGAIGPIEQAAEAFGDHPGSWLAAGWAHWVAGDSRLARLRFERALECDESFAESHGALAVVDVAEGRLDEAKRRIEIASRLDRACFSAALARVMLLEGKGQDKAAAKVRAAALGASIDGSGRTLGDAIASLARRTPKG
jgi:tetratricopeptide (TPR) repeat protein